MQTNKFVSLGIIAIMAIALLPSATAATVTFGSQVANGDGDFIATAKANDVQVAATEVLMIDLGTPGEVHDNCFLYDSDDDAKISNFDIVLTSCAGFAPGYMVKDGDNTLKNGALVASGWARTEYADVNNNGRYDAGDYVYFTTSAATGSIDASTGNAKWSIRMTPAGSLAAGTLVLSSDTDRVNYGTTTKAFDATGGIAYFDLNNNGKIDGGDDVYFTSTNVLAGGLFPLYSVRLAGTAGGFGTQVANGDGDFIATAKANDLPVAAGEVLMIDLGTPAEVHDNCFLYDSDNDAKVSNFDVVLTSCAGFTPGYMVKDGDNTLKNGALVGSSWARTEYADVNNNGRYDSGDYVYFTTAAATGSIDASTGNAKWSIRMTPAGSLAAGTLVLSSDTDRVNYGTTTKAFDANAGIAYFDLNNNGKIDGGDDVYLTSANVLAGGLFPLYSIRLAGTAGGFGTQVANGDSDFIVTAQKDDVTVAAGEVLMIDLGTPGEVHDNCFLYDSDNDAKISNFDIVLTSCAGFAPGYLVKDGDNTLKNGALVASGWARTEYADVNNNGRYDSGDYVYFTTSAATGSIDASTGNAKWSIRLTSAGSLAAGTLVLSSDTDRVNYGTTTKAFDATAGIAYFDQNNNGKIDGTDTVYLTSTDVDAGKQFPLYSIRLAGDVITGTPSTPSTPSTPPSTPSDPVTPDEPPVTPEEPPVTPEEPPVTPEEPPVTPEEEDEDDTSTPGFGLVAVLGALALVGVALRRRS